MHVSARAPGAPHRVACMQPSAGPHCGQRAAARGELTGNHNVDRGRSVGEALRVLPEC